MNPVLTRWNGAEATAAEAEILPCNGSSRWAATLVRQRPFGTAPEVFKAADECWASLALEDWREAFDSHPRLGERHAVTATATSLQWSAGEQSALVQAEDATSLLAAANREYEGRFGRIFLVCASGKTTPEILSLLRGRLGNTPEDELREAAEQQRRITQLRLRKWLGLPAARCEDV